MTSARALQTGTCSREIVITCEHGGHHVPARYRPLFTGAEPVLETHRGWDPGALHLARRFSASLHAPLFFSKVTRLLVELNRSRHHRALFSEFSGRLSAAERSIVLDRYWHPYRQQVEDALADAISRRGTVLHLSVHSFTPVFEGHRRRTDIGLLYDPQRPLETEFCLAWKAAVEARDADLVVHRNAPYRGIADGFITHLRRHFKAEQYVGVELEVNQKFVLGHPDEWRRIQRLLVDSMGVMLTGFQSASPGKHGEQIRNGSSDIPVRDPGVVARDGQESPS
ncbi:MAG: N-formylglutamate amidohydrolase [Fuerstiella sp.]